jgi:DNA-binding XRE family transcriptional regulator
MHQKYDSQFTQRVIEEIEKARHEAKMSVDTLARAAGIGRNSYFTKLRGERCFNTEEIDSIATALGLDPFIILTKAAEPTEDMDDLMHRMLANPEKYHLAANFDEHKEDERESDDFGA